MQPYVALAHGLQAAGHQVRIIAPDNFADWVRSHGIDFAPAGWDIQTFLHSDEGKEILAKGILRQLLSIRDLKRLGTKIFDESYRKIWAAIADADLIIYHPKTIYATDFAEKLQVPAIFSGFQPLSETAEYPILILPQHTLGRFLNRLSYRLMYLQRLFYSKMQNQLRAEVLGLPPQRRFATPMAVNGVPSPVLYAFSELIAPRPKDWPDDVHVVGYWLLDEAWRPDPDLAAFLDAGGPPVYVGFGSMPDQDPARTAGVVVGALEKAGIRGLIARGWGGLDPSDLPPSLYAIDAAPHDKLFPLTAAVVHHGGAGSTAAGLMAGRATLVCPHFADQPWWGRRVADLGCGPPALPAKKLTVDDLAARIDDLVNTTSFAAKARNVAMGLAQENGVARAVAVIEQVLAGANNGRHRQT